MWVVLSKHKKSSIHSYSASEFEFFKKWMMMYVMTSIVTIVSMYHIDKTISIKFGLRLNRKSIQTQDICKYVVSWRNIS